MNSMTYPYPSTLEILGRALVGGIGSHVIGGIIYALTLSMGSAYFSRFYVIIGMGFILGLFFGIVTGSVLAIVTGIIRQEKYEKAITYFSACVMFAVFFFYMHLMSPMWWHLLLNVVMGMIGAWVLTHWVLDLPRTWDKHKIGH
jgi:hypothetical protein